MTETIREGETATCSLLDVLEVIGAPLSDVVDVAKATGTNVDDMRSTAFGSIGASQLRDISVTLRRSPDELLAIASAPEVELARRKAIVKARQDLQDAAMVLEDRARGAACLMRQMFHACLDDEATAAISLLADVLADAAADVAQARGALTERTRGALT